MVLPTSDRKVSSLGVKHIYIFARENFCLIAIARQLSEQLTGVSKRGGNCNDYTIVTTYIVAYLCIYMVLSVVVADCEYCDLLVHVGSARA